MPNKRQPSPVATSADLTAKPIKRRNRLATMERILKATQTVMASRGVDKTGVNAIAEEAGVNKVLLYRYFGGLNGIIEAFVQRGFFLTLIGERRVEWIPERMPPIDGHARLRAQCEDVVLAMLSELRQRPASRQLLRWEAQNGQTELARRLTALRVQAFTALADRIVPTACDDKTAMVAWLWGALVHLVLSAENGTSLLELGLEDVANWKRMERALIRLVRGVLPE